MRGRILLLAFSLLIPMILVRYFYIQIIEGNEHREYMDSLRTLVVPLKAYRGRILTSDGVVLAWSEKTYTARISAGKIPDREKLADLLGDRRANELISGGEIEVNRIEASELERMGVSVEKKITRRYSGLAPHIVGYVNSDGKGVAGIERVYDSVLKGKKGSLLVLVDASGRVMGRVMESPPTPGKDVVLTIRADLQKKAEEILKREGKPGTVVLMDIRDGSVLAMASYPSFDPNIMSSGIAPREWLRLVRDPKGPFVNRSISALYPPGSSIKPFIALAYLLKFGSRRYEVNCIGRFDYKNRAGETVATYWDWLETGHGITDLVKAIRVSCNVFFYRIGLEIGIDFMRKVAYTVKLDEKTGIDLPGEVEGLFPSRAWKVGRFGEVWYPGDTILVSIGQGYVRLTPIELLVFYSLLANEGVEYVPHVVGKIGDDPVEKKVRLRVNVSDWIWKELKKALVEVTSHPGDLRERGTAYRVFHDFDVRVAGKTGTAEVPGGTHSWFLGFAPADSPEVAVVVMVEKGGSGGETAAPMAREILNAYFHPSR